MVRPSRPADRIEKNRLRALRRAEREDMIRVVGGDDAASPSAGMSDVPQAQPGDSDRVPRNRI